MTRIVVLDLDLDLAVETLARCAKVTLVPHQIHLTDDQAEEIGRNCVTTLTLKFMRRIP